MEGGGKGRKVKRRGRGSEGKERKGRGMQAPKYFGLEPPLEGDWIGLGVRL